VTISNIDRLEIHVSLSEHMINKVTVGDTVDVLVKSVSDGALQGRITALAPAPVTGALTYPMIITLDNTDALVKPGMFAEIRIASDTAENVLAIPTGAIMTKAGRQTVALLDADDRVLFKEVTIGVDDGEQVEIRSGLADGDRLVVEGQFYLDESSAVSVIE
jgi:RND family efflux transporter MFP subunit